MQARQKGNLKHKKGEKIMDRMTAQEREENKQKKEKVRSESASALFAKQQSKRCFGN